MQKYDITTRVLHWSMAVMIIGLCGVGLIMGELDRADPLRPTLFMLHKATGFVVLFLAIIRLCYSPRKGLSLPNAIQGWERKLAVAVKHSFYALMLLVPLSGFLYSNAAGRDLNFYNLFDIPAFMERNEQLSDLFHESHEILAYLIICLIVLHIAGAVKHRLSENKDEDVLNRML